MKTKSHLSLSSLFGISLLSITLLGLLGLSTLSSNTCLANENTFSIGAEKLFEAMPSKSRVTKTLQNQTGDGRVDQKIKSLSDLTKFKTLTTIKNTAELKCSQHKITTLSNELLQKINLAELTGQNESSWYSCAIPENNKVSVAVYQAIYRPEHVSATGEAHGTPSGKQGLQRFESVRFGQLECTKTKIEYHADQNKNEETYSCAVLPAEQLFSQTKSELPAAIEQLMKINYRADEELPKDKISNLNQKNKTKAQ